jgi:hypothetical protein
MTKYAPLQAFLQSSPNSREMLTFSQVEQILGFPLPASASAYRPWWGNDITRVHAKAWLDAGWKVESVSLGHSVTFVKSGVGHAAPAREPIKLSASPRLTPGRLLGTLVERPRQTSNLPSASANKIVLISCGKQKCGHRAPARDMYTSPRFRMALAYARRVAVDDMHIFILSAKYGLVPLNREIEPYEMTLNNMSAPERQAWARTVLAQLAKAADIENNVFVFLAGSKYNQDLLPALKHYELPLRGKGQGETMQWLSEQTCR